MDDATLRRIQKLLAIAEDGRGDPNEAAAAANMAAKIMAKYQLDHKDVIMASLKDDLNTADFTAAARKNKPFIAKLPIWVNWIGVQVARLNNCEMSLGRDPRGQETVRFYGHKDETLLCQWMMVYLIGTVNQLCKAFRGNGMESGISYRKGVAQGICSTIKRTIDANKIEIQTTPGTSLVVVKNAAIKEKWGDFNYSQLKGNISDPSAKSLGYQDGKKVDIHRRGINGSEQLKIK